MSGSLAETFAALAIVAGGGFTAIAGLGVLRFGDVFLRMHASTKAGTLGLGFIVIGVAVALPEGGAAARAALIVAFILLTAPVAAHLVGRAAWRNGTPLVEKDCLDEWQGRSLRTVSDGSERAR